MAKENFVLLTGQVFEFLGYSSDGNQGRFSLTTLRRNGKIDNPIISVFGKDLVKKIKSFKKGDFVQVKGLLTTLDVKKSSICSNCNHKNTAKGTLTTVTAVDICKLGLEAGATLYDVQEFSNNVIVVGTVSNHPKQKTLPSGTTNTSYQIALNRKYHVKEQKMDQKSDYPWVSTFGEQSDEDILRLKQGSQILINGGLQVRKTKRRIMCESCSSEIYSEDILTEIVPYSVEYLSDCNLEIKTKTEEIE